ncbi:MAG TPA: D-alanyl-D-alanine carboxypeptidase/D-alanyl-D-alanine-endopeptidase [Gemmataceae bacterium]|jgi:D-alanyl-D-alanine carboxypeptidase/D-alanyl-D-alanine-endopeptidase (penicillin-binding protein 4)|nr:D-alanyl-D-alanine carboxypeptidase/D-alanyl-D-alanine-endopeptidase [Gemmataceae bacterium]
MFSRLTTVALLFLIAGPLRSDDLADKIKAITDAPEYKAARWGILVVDAASGRTVYEQNADKLMLPASVTKLYTCANALNEFGPDYRFVTPVVRRGEIKDKVLDGDLILIASGDLTFGGRRNKAGATVFADADHTYANSGLMDSQVTDTDPLYALNELAKQVAKSITEVRGEVLIDDRLFNRARSSGSGPDVVAPILVNDNVVDVVVTPGAKEGDPAVVKLRPETSMLQVDGDVTTAKAGGSTAIGIEAISSKLKVRGRIAMGAKAAVRIHSVDDPTVWARGLFIEALRRNGVTVAAKLDRPSQAELPARDADLPRVAEYKSEPFAETIKVTLKVSHNLYASTLPILVGLRHGSGSAEAGLRQQGKFLKGLGLDSMTVSFAGGAGGANADSVTARTTVGLIQAMAKHKAATAYFDALPILGVDGTLAESVPKDSPARGKARAKTGTLSWYDSQNQRLVLRSKALGGQIETAKGTKLYFAIFLNDMPLPPGGQPSAQGKVLGKLCEVIYRHGP